MLFCLSSSARIRYLEDVVRALAAPNGADLQFRYDQSLIEPSLLERLKSGALTRKQVLICYLFSNDKETGTAIVPCRYGTIAEVTVVGSSVVLLFELGAFAAVANYDDLNAKLRTSSKNAVPNWVLSEAEHKLVGWFVFETEDGALPVEPSRDITTFERTVRQLITFSDFQNKEQEPRTWLFFHVLALKRRVEPFVDLSFEPTYQSCCPFKVTPGRSYSLQIYHYYPNPGRYSGRFSREIEVSAAGESILFQSGKTIQVDTEYDIKTFNLFIKRHTNEKETSISMGVVRREEAPLSEIAIPVQINLNWLWVTAQIAIIGLGVTIPAYVGLLTSGKEPGIWSIVLMFLGGCLAGAAATLGYKRGL